MKAYCKHRDILLDKSKYLNCHMCPDSRCETFVSICDRPDGIAFEEEEQRLVTEHLREKKLKRILE